MRRPFPAKTLKWLNQEVDEHLLELTLAVGCADQLLLDQLVEQDPFSTDGLGQRVGRAVPPACPQTRIPVHATPTGRCGRLVTACRLFASSLASRLLGRQVIRRNDVRSGQLQRIQP